MALNTQLDGNILGIDIGTSGIRAAIVSPQNDLLHSAHVDMPFPQRSGENSEQSPEIWQTALTHLLTKLSKETELSLVRHIVADATSSTVLLIDENLIPVTSALMYDDSRSKKQAEIIKTVAADNTGAQGATSTLAKVMWLEESHTSKKNYRIYHQIDWLNSFFTQTLVPTDANNALKLGYDVMTRCWPDWVANLLQTSLPKVVMPGSVIGTISPSVAEQYYLSSKVTIHAGTTDSIAAFLASGANQMGDATTSLGSTLSLKLLSKTPVFSPSQGVYSHMLGHSWLVGGASNTGGAVLLKHFSIDQIIDLLEDIDCHTETALNYYPLASQGERFPICDSHMQPKISPRPEQDGEFLKGLIEGLVAVEKLGYQTLEDLGASKVKKVYATGGGTKNTVWMKIREKNLGYKTPKAAYIDAAFGVTQLLIKQF